MKIVLWGATGLTGREVLSQALEDGHEVKAVVRKPEQIKVEHAIRRFIALVAAEADEH
ncbi:MAG: NAD(P)H-binding protein [Deltaproteobacteria bacterium]|nr:NAD(P)H-binding protein [Deltaproteobacteria bacterium]